MIPSTNRLDYDSLFQVFSNLSNMRDLTRAGSACSEWQEVSLVNHLWKPFFASHFPSLTINVLEKPLGFLKEKVMTFYANFAKGQFSESSIPRSRNIDRAFMVNGQIVLADRELLRIYKTDLDGNIDYIRAIYRPIPRSPWTMQCLMAGSLFVEWHNRTFYVTDVLQKGQFFGSAVLPNDISEVCAGENRFFVRTENNDIFIISNHNGAYSYVPFSSPPQPTRICAASKKTLILQDADNSHFIEGFFKNEILKKQSIPFLDSSSTSPKPQSTFHFAQDPDNRPLLFVESPPSNERSIDVWIYNPKNALWDLLLHYNNREFLATDGLYLFTTEYPCRYAGNADQEDIYKRSIFISKRTEKSFQDIGTLTNSLSLRLFRTNDRSPSIPPADTEYQWNCHYTFATAHGLLSILNKMDGQLSFLDGTKATPTLTSFSSGHKWACHIGFTADSQLVSYDMEKGIVVRRFDI